MKGLKALAITCVFAVAPDLTVIVFRMICCFLSGFFENPFVRRFAGRLRLIETGAYRSAAAFPGRALDFPDGKGNNGGPYDQPYYCVEQTADVSAGEYIAVLFKKRIAVRVVIPVLYQFVLIRISLDGFGNAVTRPAVTVPFEKQRFMNSAFRREITRQINKVRRTVNFGFFADNIWVIIFALYDFRLPGPAARVREFFFNYIINGKSSAFIIIFFRFFFAVAAIERIISGFRVYPKFAPGRSLRVLQLENLYRLLPVCPVRDLAFRGAGAL